MRNTNLEWVDEGNFYYRKYPNGKEEWFNAICELRGEERHFRLDRIVSAEILNQKEKE